MKHFKTFFYKFIQSRQTKGLFLSTPFLLTASQHNNEIQKCEYIENRENKSTFGWFKSNSDKEKEKVNTHKINKLNNTYFRNTDKFMVLSVLDKSSININNRFVWLFYGPCFIILVTFILEGALFWEWFIPFIGINILGTGIGSIMDNFTRRMVFLQNIKKCDVSNIISKHLNFPGNRHVLIQEFKDLSEDDISGVMYIYTDNSVSVHQVYNVYDVIKNDQNIGDIYFLDTCETKKLKIPVIHGGKFNKVSDVEYEIPDEDKKKIKELCGINKESNPFELLSQIKSVIYWYKKDGVLQVVLVHSV